MTPEPEHILILEDDPRFWAIVAHNLSRAGYKVTAVQRLFDPGTCRRGIRLSFDRKRRSLLMLVS
jgi:DNA-binding response OmpR family regulator